MEAIHPKVREAIEYTYMLCFNTHDGDSALVLDNFEYNQAVRDSLFRAVREYLEENYELEVDNNDLMFIYEKVLASYIAQKRRKLNIKGNSNFEPSEEDRLKKIEENQKWIMFLEVTNALKK